MRLEVYQVFVCLDITWAKKKQEKSAAHHTRRFSQRPIQFRRPRILLPPLLLTPCFYRPTPLSIYLSQALSKLDPMVSTLEKDTVCGHQDRWYEGWEGGDMDLVSCADVGVQWPVRRSTSDSWSKSMGRECWIRVHLDVDVGICIWAQEWERAA